MPENEDNICWNCGEEISEKWTMIDNWQDEYLRTTYDEEAVFCCEHCVDAYREKLWNELNVPDNKETNICEMCGKEEEKPINSWIFNEIKGNTLAFCSYNCSLDYQKQRYYEFSRQYEKTWRENKKEFILCNGDKIEGLPLIVENCKYSYFGDYSEKNIYNVETGKKMFSTEERINKKRKAYFVPEEWRLMELAIFATLTKDEGFKIEIEKSFRRLEVQLWKEM